MMWTDQRRRPLRAEPGVDEPATAAARTVPRRGGAARLRMRLSQAGTRQAIAAPHRPQAHGHVQQRRRHQAAVHRGAGSLQQSLHYSQLINKIF